MTNFFLEKSQNFKTDILKSSKNFSKYKYSLDYENELFLIKKIIEISKNKIKLNHKNIVKIINSNKFLKKISDQNLERFKK